MTNPSTLELDPSSLGDPSYGWSNRAGTLKASVNANGSLRALVSGDVQVNLFPGTELEGGPTQLLLRRHGGSGAIEAAMLLGPRAAGVAWRGDGRAGVRGQALGLRYQVELVLDDAQTAWFWHVELQNLGESPVRADLIFMQDVALATFGAIRTNEAYVSQYIDHQPLRHPRHGMVIASRQSAAVGGRFPWLMTGSLAHAIAYATDALQTLALDARAGRALAIERQGLPGHRLQHEHSQVSLQDDVFEIAPQAVERRGFFGWLRADHPLQTTQDDLEAVDRAMSLPARHAPHAPSGSTAGPRSDNLFVTAPLLAAADVSDAEAAEAFGVSSMRLTERDAGGRVLSFFADDARHVVMRRKELEVLRPQGQLMRSGSHWTPDESSLASTVWMAGVFHSSLTQGHASANRCLSTQRGYLSMFRAHGLRVFVDAGEGWRLLDVPSAMEFAPNRCRWLYRHANGVLMVTASASLETPEVSLAIEVGEGAPVRLLIAQHIAMNDDDGWSAHALRWDADGADLRVRPARGSSMHARFASGVLRIRPAGGTRWTEAGDDALLFVDGRSRRQPYLCLRYDATRRAALTLRGELIAEKGPVQYGAPETFLIDTSARLRLTAPASADDDAVETLMQLEAIAPWFAQNALVHYLSPRGLEQFTGGGWGTRDVSQGPVELLLALGRHAPVRDLLLRVFRAQNTDGDWPQWFMFYERDAAVRAGDSHGDVVFWPLVALAQYLTASGDATILDAVEPFHGQGIKHTIVEHVERAFALIAARMIAGTQLVAYGHGDWNDALQPADPSMREHLCSAWTVTLHYRMLTLMADAWERIGRGAAAMGLRAQASQVLFDFQRLLVVDAQVVGYASFERPNEVGYLLHKRDARTGIHFSALPMIHAIIDELFTKDQAAAHVSMIREHLWGPDGLRLFDRPLRYSGGLQKLFQRGESASYFGREIGLMYMHAHLRFAEALAHLGRADEFFEALRLAHPIGINALVESAARRQSNCYFSSSDARFDDREQALREYSRIGTGEVALEGGWRVYSSGAGIAFRLIVQSLLGLRQEHDRLVVDPVIPASLDGMCASLQLYGFDCDVHYRIGDRGYGATRVSVNDRDMALAALPNRYRIGAASVGASALRALLGPRRNRIEIDLGA